MKKKGDISHSMEQLRHWERPIGKTVLLSENTPWGLIPLEPMERLPQLFTNEVQEWQKSLSLRYPTWKATRHSEGSISKNSADHHQSSSEQVETILQSRKKNSLDYSINQRGITILKDSILIHPATSVSEEFGLLKISAPLSFYQRQIMEEAVLRMNSLQIVGRGYGKTFQYLSRKFMAEQLGGLGLRHGTEKMLDAFISAYPKDITAIGIWGQIKKIEEILQYPYSLGITKNQIEIYLKENY